MHAVTDCKVLSDRFKGGAAGLRRGFDRIPGGGPAAVAAADGDDGGIAAILTAVVAAGFNGAVDAPVGILAHDVSSFPNVLVIFAKPVPWLSAELLCPQRAASYAVAG